MRQQQRRQGQESHCIDTPRRPAPAVDEADDSAQMAFSLPTSSRKAIPGDYGRGNNDNNKKNDKSKGGDTLVVEAG